MDSDDDDPEFEIPRCESVNSEWPELSNKKHRRKRKRAGAKKEVQADSLSLNLDQSFKSSTHTYSSSDNLSFHSPEDDDDEGTLIKLRNFDIRNRVCPVQMSPQVSKSARFFVIKATYEDDLHKVLMA